MWLIFHHTNMLFIFGILCLQFFSIGYCLSRNRVGPEGMNIVPGHHHKQSRRHHIHRFGYPGSDVACSTSPLHDIDVYWINLHKNIHRKEYMEKYLNYSGYLSNQRVEAIFPESEEFVLRMLEKPCKRNTQKDLAVIMSHLKAIYQAIHSDSTSEVALILEDDIRFLYDIDFSALIASAPPSFGILQLVTSSVEAIDMMWSKFLDSGGQRLWTQNKWNDMTRDRKTTLFWSAQAYLINKTTVAPFIKDVIELDEHGRLAFKIVNSFEPRTCHRKPNRPCILANCLFSDSYIYAGGGPTYVSHIPLLTGAKIGMVSSVHQDQIYAHELAFSRIAAVDQLLQSAGQWKESIALQDPSKLDRLRKYAIEQSRVEVTTNAMKATKPEVFRSDISREYLGAILPNFISFGNSSAC